MVSGSLGVYFFLFVAVYFEVFLLISFLEKRPQKRTDRLPARYPDVCIIVPVWNEEKTLEETLRSLLALDYPKEKLSIMIIDDGSKDNTAQIARRMLLEDSRISYHHKENGGKYTAVNYGITHTNAELVGCLDADSFVAPDALLEMVKAFENNPEVYALAPAMKVFRPRSILELMQMVEYTSGIFYKKMLDNLSAISVVPGPFSFYRRSVFEKIGLFRHAHNTEDMEIAFRMHTHGLKIANVHTAYVYTTVPTSVRGLIKQRTRWSQGYLQNSIDYRYMYFNPKFGNFGLLVLPFGLLASIAGLYTAVYSLYHFIMYWLGASSYTWSTGIPFHLNAPRFEWFFLNTSMMNFLIIATLTLTLIAIFIGSRMAQERKISAQSILLFFALFGVIAPFWLARSMWGALRGKQSAWR